MVSMNNDENGVNGCRDVTGIPDHEITEKERIYDEKIAPLMSQILEICKEHKIGVVSSFALDPKTGLCCSTAMCGGVFDSPPSYFIFAKVLGMDVPLPPGVDMVASLVNSIQTVYGDKLKK